MKYRSAAIAGVVGVAVLGLVIVFALSPAGGNKDVRSRILGEVAPAIAGPELQGGNVDLDSFRGEWVLVNFFASWCPECVVEHPELVKLSKDDGGPIQVLSVGYQDSNEALQKTFRKYGGRWPVVTGDTEKLGFEYGVKAVPESFLVSPFGRVAVKFEGGVTADEVMSYIRRSEAGAEGTNSTAPSSGSSGANDSLTDGSRTNDSRTSDSGADRSDPAEPGS